MEYRIIRTDNELYHYGVPGMKWGVRKKENRSAGIKNINRRVKRLNRANSSMEKYDNLNRHLSNQRNGAKKSKNPLIKLYAASHVIDREFSKMMYNRGKEKVNKILADLNRDGVTLKELGERKNGITIGPTYDYMNTWMGVKYSVVDQAINDKY